MSIEEQLKQPWAKGIRKPINVGDPFSYPTQIDRIDFEDGYKVEWCGPECARVYGWRVTLHGELLYTLLTLQTALKMVRQHSEARCLKDLEAARTAWEAEEKRKNAPECINVSMTYYRDSFGNYTLSSRNIDALGSDMRQYPKMADYMPLVLNSPTTPIL